MHPRTVARNLKSRGLDVEDQTARQRRERLDSVRPAAWRAQAEARAAEARERTERFAALGGTWEALMQMAESEGVTRKSMADALRRAGAAVPDGRGASPLKGAATGRVYPTKPKVQCSEDGCDR